MPADNQPREQRPFALWFGAALMLAGAIPLVVQDGLERNWTAAGWAAVVVAYAIVSLRAGRNPTWRANWLMLALGATSLMLVIAQFLDLW